MAEEVIAQDGQHQTDPAGQQRNDSGALEPVPQPWWRPFSGPFLYYSSRRYLTAPLRAVVDCIGTLRP